LEICENTLDCTDTFSASFTSTGAVVPGSENVDWILGFATITDTSKFAFTINTGIFSVKPNCSATMASDVSGVSQSAVIDITSNTTMSVRTLAGGGKSAQPFTVICQKAGIDYIGKTAKAVASDQNLRTPGLVNGGIFSASFGGTSYRNNCTASPCTVSTNHGSIVTTTTRTSTGVYVINLDTSKISDGTTNNIICSCSSVQWGTGPSTCTIYNFSTSSLSVTTRNSGGTVVDSGVQVMCQGIFK
jgi:hypothetical protein